MRRITPKICKNNHGCAVLLRAACDAFNPDPKQLTPSVKLSCICTAELQSTSEAADTHYEAVSGGIHVPVLSLPFRGAKLVIAYTNT